MYSALVLYQYEAELAVSALLLEEKEYDVCDFCLFNLSVSAASEIFGQDKYLDKI